MAERVKYYTDEHVPKAVIAGLRRRGVDVLTVQQSSSIGELVHGLMLVYELFDRSEKEGQLEYI